jgi:hypothetical protein
MIVSYTSKYLRLPSKRQKYPEMEITICWKHCSENSQAWQDEQRRIKDEADKKRSGLNP